MTAALIVLVVTSVVCVGFAYACVRAIAAQAERTQKLTRESAQDMFAYMQVAVADITRTVGETVSKVSYPELQGPPVDVAHEMMAALERHAPLVDDTDPTDQYLQDIRRDAAPFSDGVHEGFGIPGLREAIDQ